MNPFLEFALNAKDLEFAGQQLVAGHHWFYSALARRRRFLERLLSID